MKLSMWILAQRLEKYKPKCDIKDGTARISGVRFFSSEDVEPDGQYAYLGLNAEGFIESDSSESAFLINGKDTITLQSRKVNSIMNELLAIFDCFNTWEESLWEESVHESFQRLFDISDCVLGNPMILADAEGSVLAMSSEYRDEDINEHWVEARNTGTVPTEILGTPMRAQGGKKAISWTNEPRKYVMPDGTEIIGAFLVVDGENLGGFGLWEHNKPIYPGDLLLAKILCDVLTSMMSVKNRGLKLRSSAAIIEDLLSGVEIDADLIKKLELKCSSPWRLIVVKNPFHSDAIYVRHIVGKLRDHAIACVPLMYRNMAVALISEKNALPILNSFLGSREKQYHIAGLSVPFDDLKNIALRYEQTLYAINQTGGKPGVYRSEDYAFEYLLNLVGEKNKRQTLGHPAIAKLRRYDAEKQTVLCETLYHYILNERSIKLGAEAVHIHRNSFMYRLERIKALIEVDLDDPITRAYLLFSFLIEKA